MGLIIVLISIVALYIGLSLLDAYLKHQKEAKALVGKNYARIEDYGYKDHYLINRLAKCLSNICVVFIVLALYFSIFIIFLQSINNSKLVSEWHGATFDWYLQMFTNDSLNKAIIHTLVISACATALATVLGTIIAVGIHYSSKRLASHILLLNNFPLLNADIVTGISLMLVFSTLVTIDPYFFGFKTLLLAHLFFCLPYVILNVLNKLRELDQSLVDASFDLGLRSFQTLVKVIVPAVKSGIFSGAILAFTMSFDDFVISYYNTGNGYDNLSIWIYSSIGRKSLSPVVYSFTILVVVICIVVLVSAWLITYFRAKKEQKHEKK